MKKSTGAGRSEDDPNPEDIVAYIAKMSKELSDLAASARHDFLAYLLRMAHEEANRTSREG